MVGRPPALFPGIFPLGNQGIGGVGTEPNSQATAHSRSLLHAGLGKSRFLASESQHGPPKYTISQDCSDDRMVQSQRLCALRDGNPRFCFKRSLDRGSDGDDRGFGSKRQRLNSPDLQFLSVDDFVYDPPEDTITAEDTFGSHRHTRSQVEDRERPATRTGTIEMGNGDEDEAVRCICGYEDYPGPPPIDEDSKHGLKDSTALDPIFATDLTDDAAGFFVQCDLCKVWQHGACVGIKTEESSPDEYFCEQCRKDFHKTFTASNRQRYSIYLPLKRSSRAHRYQSPPTTFRSSQAPTTLPTTDRFSDCGSASVPKPQRTVSQPVRSEQARWFPQSTEMPDRGHATTLFPRPRESIRHHADAEL